jgi:hypothetical protein
MIDPKAILSIFIKKTFFKIADIPKKRTGMSGVQDHADMAPAVSEIPLVSHQRISDSADGCRKPCQSCQINQTLAVSQQCLRHRGMQLQKFPLKLPAV